MKRHNCTEFGAWDCTISDRMVSLRFITITLKKKVKLKFKGSQFISNIQIFVHLLHTFIYIYYKLYPSLPKEHFGLKRSKIHHTKE